jgi:hypothetical protein
MKRDSFLKGEGEGATCAKLYMSHGVDILALIE